MTHDELVAAGMYDHGIRCHLCGEDVRTPLLSGTRDIVVRVDLRPVHAHVEGRHPEIALTVTPAPPGVDEINHAWRETWKWLATWATHSSRYGDEWRAQA